MKQGLLKTAWWRHIITWGMILNWCTTVKTECNLWIMLLGIDITNTSCLSTPQPCQYLASSRKGGILLMDGLASTIRKSLIRVNSIWLLTQEGQQFTACQSSYNLCLFMSDTRKPSAVRTAFFWDGGTEQSFLRTKEIGQKDIKDNTGTFLSPNQSLMFPSICSMNS